MPLLVIHRFSVKSKFSVELAGETETIRVYIHYCRITYWAGIIKISDEKGQKTSKE